MQNMRGLRKLNRFQSQWGVRLISLITAVMGGINVLSATTPSVRSRIELIHFLPLEVRRGGHLTAALTGFALILLATQLWRRKHVAWLLTIFVLGISFVSHLMKGLDYEEASLSLLLIIWLVLIRHSFHARSDTPSIQHAIKVFSFALMFTLFYGVVGFYLLDHHFSKNFGFLPAIEQTILMFTQFYDPGLQPITGFGKYFADSIYLVGMITVGYSLLNLMRPVLVRLPATQEQREKAKQLVEKNGQGPLAIFGLLEDKSYFFSSGGSVISFVQKSHMALCLGDPVGPSTDISRAINEFISYCKQNDWEPVFYQIPPETRHIYKELGFSTLAIGQEAIVNLSVFNLDSPAAKKIRYSYRKLKEAGFQVEMITPPIPLPIMENLRSVSDNWLTMMHGSEKRFSLGWFDNHYLNQHPVMIVKNRIGSIVAFANLLTLSSSSSAMVDLMRYSEEAEAGTMDFLFVSLFFWAKENGYAYYDLGLSPFAGVGEHSSDPSVERALHYIYDHVNQFYNFQGLHHFKEKFHPEWAPRYLVFRNPPSLPAVAMALVRADSGDNFVIDYVKELISKNNLRPSSSPHA
jgi:phosphatidylglycerol lysyltransferase